MSKQQINLSESKLREFVSYSVARILREMKYGFQEMDLDFDPENDDNMQAAYESVLEEPDFQNISPEELESVWPVSVKVYYTAGREEGGDRGEMLDNAKVDTWEADMSSVPGNLRGFVRAVLKNFFEGGYFSENDLLDYNSANNGLFEGNIGHLAHFPGLNHGTPSKYLGMTWEEYCDAKKAEREEDKRKAELHKKNYPEDRPNLGITTHF